MSAPRTIPGKFLLQGGGPVTLAAAADSAKPGARFDMVLNSGQPFDGWGYPAILDMTGLEIPAEMRMPILRQHDAAQVIGQSDRVEIKAGALLVAGDLYDSESDAAKQVVAMGRRGFRWQASFGVRPKVDAADACEWVEKGKPVTVNGHAFDGGLWIKRSKLVEGSFVPIGADDKTHALAAAGDSPITIPNRRSTTMADPATIKDLKDAFPDKEDEGFVVAQLLAGATLDDAHKAYSAVLKDRLKAAQEAASKPAPAPAAPTRSPRLPVATASAGSPAPAPQSARDQYMALVDAEKAKGKDPCEARLAAAGSDITLDLFERKRRAALHAAYVTEANGGREWTPMAMPGR